MNARNQGTRLRFRSAAIAFSVFMIFGLHVVTKAQADGLFETASVEDLIKRQFKLSGIDIRILRPMVRRENDALLSILNRCSDEYAGNYIVLWDSIRRTNRDFEASRIDSLKPAQKRALRKARIELQSRILDYWLEKYLQNLDDLLELDWIQTYSVGAIFRDEFEKRIKILAAEVYGHGDSEASWVKLSQQRDDRLEKILTTAQYREYLESNGPVNRLVAMKSDHY